MSSKVQQRKKELGGLHLTICTGDHVTIEHAGEKIELHFVGLNGKDKYNVTAKGPDSFRIISDHYKRKKLIIINPEVKND